MSTILDKLLKIDGKQGGTIHQYLNIGDSNTQDFIDAIQRNFPDTDVSFDTLEFYAKKRGVKINWDIETEQFYCNYHTDTRNNINDGNNCPKCLKYIR